MKRLLHIFAGTLLVVVISGCSLDFLNNGEGTSDSGGYAEYDTQEDIKYYYNSDDTLRWMEYYDFDSEGRCIFVKRTLPSGTLLWSYVYAWGGGNVVLEAYFDGGNELSLFSVNSWNGGRIGKQRNYNADAALQDIKTWTYNGAGYPDITAGYDGSGGLSWACSYSYDGSGRETLVSLYGPDGARTAYIESEYTAAGDVSGKTGYGDVEWKNSLSTAFGGYSFPSWGGVNTTSRNTAGLTAPASPEDSEVTLPALTDSARDYSWMSLWVYDSYGYSMAVLNGSYLPVYLKRSAPDYLNGYPIESVLSYTGGRLTKQTATHNGRTVLDFDFSYDGSGYLTSLDTSGVSLYIPLRYEFAYSGGIPSSISLYNEETLLQKFDYEYSGSPSTPEQFAREIHTIRHYDGDGAYIGYYIFNYDSGNNRIDIAVWDAKKTENPGDDERTGSLVLTYDGAGRAVSLSAYDASGNSSWSYGYSYDDLGNLIGETGFDEDNLPRVVTTLDVETLFGGLARFLP